MPFISISLSSAQPEPDRICASDLHATSHLPPGLVIGECWCDFHSSHQCHIGSADAGKGLRRKSSPAPSRIDKQSWPSSAASVLQLYRHSREQKTLSICKSYGELGSRPGGIVVYCVPHKVHTPTREIS